MAESYVNTDAHKKEIADMISLKTGKEVEVQIQKKEISSGFEEAYVDIEKIINMDLVIEEE